MNVDDIHVVQRGSCFLSEPFLIRCLVCQEPLTTLVGKIPPSLNDKQLKDYKYNKNSPLELTLGSICPCCTTPYSLKIVLNPNGNNSAELLNWEASRPRGIRGGL